MTYSEDHIALAAEYALGTLDADERALVETMMIVDHGFMEVVDAWDRKLSPLHQMVASVEPPPHLWDNILTAVRLTGNQVPVHRPAETSTAAGLGIPDVTQSDTPRVEPVLAEADHVSPADQPFEGPRAAAASEAPVIVAEPVAARPSSVERFDDRRRGRGGAAFGWLMTAVAASLAAVVALQAYRPDLLPEKLRVKPQVRIVEIPAPAPPPPAAQFVALLQQNSSAPAFILTVDAGTKTYTVRRVGAPAQQGKSYELWLVSDKLQRPRSLGVIGKSDFTIRPALAAYDTDTINKATYAVTVEPEGGAPTGIATGPIVYTGKLVESVPELPPSALPR